MNVTEPFVLRRDVLLIPCAELSDDLRGRIAFEEGDYTLSHRFGRALVQVIDGETAALLQLFREPRTIVDAIIENGRVLGRDPRALFDELLPHVGAFVENRVLVPAGSDEEQGIRPQYESGTDLGDWKIVRCVSLIEDSEVYQLRRGPEVAALKIARDTAPALAAAFANEIAILRRLDGSGIAPRLLDSGTHDGRSFVVMEWLAGVDVSVAAAQRRHDRASLIELCASVAEAYAKLHAYGVLHADVHPRNVLVGSEVRLLDFGWSRFADEPPRTGRAGMLTFFEPEYVAARKHGTSLAATPAGEQYALAALCYQLITGKDYLDFRYEHEEMERQVETEPPVPFAARGVPPWPEVEAILFRALEKDPARRFASIQEMAARLAEARDATAREALEAPVSADAEALLDATLRSFSRGGERFTSRFTTPPTASITYGCAGAAVGLLRIAESRGDAGLLAMADIWRSRAIALIGADGAYWDTNLLRREVIGDLTPYHTESGIHAAAAMVAAAMGDDVSLRNAIQAFVRTAGVPPADGPASRRPGVAAELDLTLGRSGTLLAAALLLPVSEGSETLRHFGSATLREIWRELDARPPLDQSPDDPYLGIAHGWAGYLYAALQWCAASGDAVPPRAIERLHELAALRTAEGRGVYWCTSVHSASRQAGWCNGTAGHVFLWTLAHRLLGDPQWLELAELAAWNEWDEPRTVPTLCCGTAGRAYALLNFYRHTGATAWLSRARQLANHAAAHAYDGALHPGSLWKGELGVAVLIADLASPENARMPFFE